LRTGRMDGFSAPSPQSAGCTAAAPAGRRRRALYALAVFGFFFCLFAFTMRGFLTFDEENMYLVTEAVCEHGRISIDPSCSILSSVRLFPGRGGKLYSYLDIGQSLLAAPFYVSARPIAETLAPAKRELALRFAVNHLGPLAGAATVLLLWLLLQRLGLGKAEGLFWCFTLALTTPLWFYSRTFFRAPTLAFFYLAAAYFFMLSCNEPRNLLYPLCCGAAVFAAVLIKLSAVLFCLGPLLVFLFSERFSPLRLRRILLALIPVTFAFFITFLYNVARFGTFTLQFLPPGGFSRAGLAGLWENLLSPGRGLFTFAPLLWLVFPVARFIISDSTRRPLWLCLGLMVACDLALYSKIEGINSAGVCWGPRYLVPLLPLFFILLAAGFHKLYEERPQFKRRFSAAILILGLYGAVIQLEGVLGGERERLFVKKQGIPYKYSVYLPDCSPAYNPALWLHALNCNTTRLPEGAGGIDLGNERLRMLWMETPAVWWLFVWRLGLKSWYLLPALLELLGLVASGLVLFRVFKLKEAPSRPSPESESRRRQAAQKGCLAGW